jgi:hypothetical protein
MGANPMFSDIPIPLLVGVFSSFGHLVTGLLAVVGAFFVGNILTGILVWSFYRGVKKRKCNPLAMRALRLIGGVLLALIVAAIFFGEGGFGLEGGGETPGPDGVPGKAGLTDDSKDSKKEANPEKKQGDVSAEERIRITMLGEEAKDDRFYLFEDQPQPKNFTEIKDLILQRKMSSTKPVTEIAIYTYKNTADRANRIVTRLDKWAQEQGFHVSYRESRDRLRPE